MLFNYKYLFLLIGSFIWLTSCTKRIELDLDKGNTRLIVEGEVTTESKIQTVKLSYSAEYLINKPMNPVEDAQVTISDGMTTVTLVEVTPGTYQTPDIYQAQVGKTYTLKIRNVKIDGVNQSYEASETVQPVWVIDTIINEHFVDEYTGDGYEGIMFYGHEPSTLGQCYMWRYYNNNVLKTDTLNKWLTVIDDPMYNDITFAGELPLFTIEEDDYQYGDTIKLETRSISKKYYDFIQSVLSETQYSGSAFNGPPANVIGNISNNALGYFNAVDVDYVTTILTEH